MDSLQENIVTGRYGVGSALPTENELCVTFGVSRYTVREALRRLAERGLVERRQGSGTQVIASAPKARYAHSVEGLSELCELGDHVSFHLERVERVAREPSAEEAALGMRPGWTRADGVAREGPGGPPLCHARIYLPGRFAHLADRLDGTREVHAMVEQQGGEIAEVVQRIAFEPMPADVVRSLGEAHAWSVRFSRQYLDEGATPLLVVVSWHPAGSVSYTTRLRRNVQ